MKNWVLPREYPPLLILPLKPINKAPKRHTILFPIMQNWVLPKKYPILPAIIKNWVLPT